MAVQLALGYQLDIASVFRQCEPGCFQILVVGPIAGGGGYRRILQFGIAFSRSLTAAFVRLTSVTLSKKSPLLADDSESRVKRFLVRLMPQAKTRRASLGSIVPGAAADNLASGGGEVVATVVLVVGIGSLG